MATGKPNLQTVQKSLQWTFETVQWHRRMTQLRRQSVPGIWSGCGVWSGVECYCLHSGHQKLVLISGSETGTTWDGGSRHIHRKNSWLCIQNFSKASDKRTYLAPKVYSHVFFWFLLLGSFFYSRKLQMMWSPRHAPVTSHAAGLTVCDASALQTRRGVVHCSSPVGWTQRHGLVSWQRHDIVIAGINRCGREQQHVRPVTANCQW